MNHAYVDASWQELPSGSSLAGWGLVLLLPSHLPARFQGQLDAYDNNAAELRSVLEAVRIAPAGQTLTVHTDNQAVIASVSRGRGPQLLTDLTHEIHDEAQARQITMHARYAPRTGRHMLTAHNLANDARRGAGGPVALSQTDVLIEQRSGHQEARVTLRRNTGQGQAERVAALVQIDPTSDVPPSVQVLLAALQLAQPGEVLSVRRASRVAQALWQKPERALRPAVNASLRSARALADGQGVTVEFLGTGD